MVKKSQPTGSDLPLATMFHQLNELSWVDPGPEEILSRLRDSVVSHQLPLAQYVAQYLAKRPEIGLVSHDLITRTEYDLYVSPAGTFESCLHDGLEVVTPNSHIKPHINAKGYWLLTFVLHGSITVANYLLDNVPDESWFRHEYLKRIGEDTYPEDTAFILSPDQIHRLDAIAAGTVTMTIRVNAGAGRYRNYLRQMDHYSAIYREPRGHRLGMLIERLRSFS